MTDELQPEQELPGHIPEEFLESDEVEESTEEPGTASAPAADNNGEDHAAKFTPEQQKIVDREIGKKVAKVRETERELERTKARLAELESKSNQEARPVIPPMPDPLNHTQDEWKRVMDEREAIVQKAARYDERTAQQQAEQQRAAQEIQRAEQESLNLQVESYAQRAEVLGVSKADLLEAGRTVGDFGIADSVARTILADEYGPLITKYLAGNLTLLDEIRRLDPVTAGIKIAVEVKPRAMALKPKVNNAPDPLNVPGRSGKAPTEGGPAGATYEWGE